MEKIVFCFIVCVFSQCSLTSIVCGWPWTCTIANRIAINQQLDPVHHQKPANWYVGAISLPMLVPDAAFKFLVNFTTALEEREENKNVVELLRFFIFLKFYLRASYGWNLL